MQIGAIGIERQRPLPRGGGERHFTERLERAGEDVPCHDVVGAERKRPIGLLERLFRAAGIEQQSAPAPGCAGAPLGPRRAERNLRRLRL